MWISIDLTFPELDKNELIDDQLSCSNKPICQISGAPNTLPHLIQINIYICDNPFHYFPSIYLFNFHNNY